MDDRLQFAPCGYVALTHKGIVVDVNQTFLQMMGYRYEDLVSQHLECMMSTTNKLIFHSYFYPFIHLDGKVEELVISLKDSGGQATPFIINGRKRERDGEEQIDCILVQMGKRMNYETELRTAKKQIEEAYWEKDRALAELRQIHAEIERKQSELIEINAVLAELSVTDKLTGLKNRRYFQEQLKEQLESCQSSGKPFSLLILDIDHFKRVNDTWGHPAGDQVLVDVAQILNAHSRSEDVAARYGGEEFVMMLPDVDVPESRKIGERLRAAAAEMESMVGKITVSIGLASAVLADTETTIIKKADEALYASKQNGRNRVTHILDVQKDF